MKIRKLYKLKQVYRATSVEKRKESSAEHTWSSLMLADYFLNVIKRSDINKLKVFELLMYHDVVEIESGDIPIHHENKRKHKKENEQKALKKLIKELPENTAKQLAGLFVEFEEKSTVEAKFANVIDKLDAMIHELDYKEDWKGWTDEMMRRYYVSKSFEEFPEIKKVFDSLIEYVKVQGYIENN